MARIATFAQKRTGGSIYTALANKRSNNELQSTDLTLYDYEASPYCRRVRQSLSDLELRCAIRPCPRSTLFQEGVVDSSHRPLISLLYWNYNVIRSLGMRLISSNCRFRSEAQALYEAQGLGRLRFPLLVDRSQGKEEVIHESKAIVSYLWKHYGSEEGAKVVEASLNRGERRGVALSAWIPG